MSWDEVSRPIVIMVIPNTYRWCTQQNYLVPDGFVHWRINSLAKAEIFIAASTIFRRFDFEMCDTTLDDIQIRHDLFIPRPKNLKTIGVQARLKGKLVASTISEKWWVEHCWYLRSCSFLCYIEHRVFFVYTDELSGCGCIKKYHDWQEPFVFQGTITAAGR